MKRLIYSIFYFYLGAYLAYCGVSVIEHPIKFLLIILPTAIIIEFARRSY